MAAEKKTKKKESSKKKSTIFSNYWAVASLVLAILLVLSLTLNNGGFGSDSVSAEVAAQNLVDFASSQGVSAEVISTSDDGDFYTVTLSIQGQEQDLQVTKDGKNLVQAVPIVADDAPAANPNPNTPTPTPTEVTKSERPQVELYVWGYCPYGVQAQGPLSEVAQLLGDTADITIVPYHDGHGAYENQQNKIQSCIQELEDSDTYWKYAEGFVTDVYPACSSTRTEECDLAESTTLMNELGIDSDAVIECVENEGDALYNAARTYAQQNGVTGSPTVIINGVKVNVARNAPALQAAICDAYTDAPAECDDAIESTATAAAAPAAGAC